MPPTAAPAATGIAVPASAALATVADKPAGAATPPLDREHGRKRSGGRREAPAHEQRAQLVERPLHPHAGGILGELEPRPDLRKGPFLEKAQQENFPVARVQPLHRFVEHGAEPIPVGGGRRIGRQFMHGMSLLLAPLPPLLGAEDFPDGEMRGGIEPAGQRRMPRKFPRLAGRKREHPLGHILGPVGISAQLPPRGAVHKVEAPLHPFREGILGIFLGIGSEQLGVIPHEFIIQ